jgi:PAS domain-containing protein
VTPSSSATTDTTAARATAPTTRAGIFFWLALVALGLSVVTVIAMTAYTRRMERWLEHTTWVHQTTRSALLDVTGPLPRTDRVSAGSFSVDAARAIARFDTVGDSTSDNPAQMTRMRAIRELAGEWSNAVLARPAVAPGLASAIEAKVQEFLAEEERLYRMRADRFQQAQSATAITVALELVFVAAILIAYARRNARDIAVANEQQQRLEEQAAEVEEQAMELEISNHELRQAATQIEQERKNAADHARDGERATALLHTALNSAPLAVALVDDDLRYLHVNTRWTELTGADQSRHVGRRFGELPFSRDAYTAALNVITTALETRTPSLNVPLAGHGVADSTGDPRQWLLSATPLAGGVTGGVAITLLDVTTRGAAV